MTRKLNLPTTVTRKIGGAEVTFNVEEMPDASVVRLFEYGFRLMNDAFASAKNGAGESWDNETAKRIRSQIVDSVYTGKIAESARAGGVAAPRDPVASLAHKRAKEFMVARWQAKHELRKLADLFEADEKVQTFIEMRDGKPVWREDAVADLIGVAAKAGVRDFRADAEAELADAKDADGLDDLI